MGSKAFESPLISHARMRGLYRGLVESRVLAQAAGRGRGWPKGLEACWVGTALDLKDGDLTSDGGEAWLTEYVRALGASEDARGATAAEVRKACAAAAAARGSELVGTAAERMLVAIGQAMALKSVGGGVVVAYLGAGEMKAAQWRRMLEVAEPGALPLVVVVTPHAGAARLRRMAVPVIPVDAGDAVAIYRVAQESLVRARADGGVVVIECVECGVDPVTMMGAQLVKKGICTQRWVAAVETRFRRLVAGG